VFYKGSKLIPARKTEGMIMPLTESNFTVTVRVLRENCFINLYVIVTGSRQNKVEILNNIVSRT